MTTRPSQDSVLTASGHGGSSEQNTGLVMQTYDAVGRGDVPAVLGLLTDDVTWTLQGPAEIPFAGSYHGRAGVATFFQRVAETLTFEQFEPHTVIGQGDLVVVLGFERSTIRSTGRTLTMEWAHVYTLGNGRITAFRAFEDTAALVAALAPA